VRRTAPPLEAVISTFIHKQSSIYGDELHWMLVGCCWVCFQDSAQSRYQLGVLVFHCCPLFRRDMSWLYIWYSLISFLLKLL
jgi:hypothetical protein